MVAGEFGFRYQAVSAWVIFDGDAVVEASVNPDLVTISILGKSFDTLGEKALHVEQTGIGEQMLVGNFIVGPN